jgi:uncharacterized protein (TIGR03067 family)
MTQRRGRRQRERNDRHDLKLRNATMKTTNGLVLAAALILVGVPHAAPAQEAGAKPAAAAKGADHGAMQGKWNIIEVHLRSGQVPNDKVEGSTMEFAGDKMTLTRAGGAPPRVIIFTLDEGKKHFDTTHEERKMSNVGIYELKADELRLCINDDAMSTEHPTAMKVEEKGPNGTMFVLRRAKP